VGLLRCIEGGYSNWAQLRSVISGLAAIRLCSG
jgi:hypothetical protein